MVKTDIKKIWFYFVGTSVLYMLSFEDFLSRVNIKPLSQSSLDLISFSNLTQTDTFKISRKLNTWYSEMHYSLCVTNLMVRVSKTLAKMLNGEKPNIGPCKIWVEALMSFPIGNYIWKLIIRWHVICLNGALSMLYLLYF